MHSINSASNAKIKETTKLHQKKYRDEKNLFLAEGKKFLEELVESNVKIKDVFVVEGFDSAGMNLPLNVVSESVMKKLSTTESVCEVLAVAEKRTINKKDFSLYKKVLLLDSIADPGNLGTIIRSAAAFGFDGIVLFGNCVDLYSSKVIRSSAGNFFKVPVISVKSVEEIEELFKNSLKIATLLSDKNNIKLEECSKNSNLLVMMGCEASGLSLELAKIADKNLKLDMAKGVESLNLAVSASIIMYELFKTV